jgi:DNA-binding response OmpR family regulator
LKAKVLLVEDDPSLMIALRDGFEDEGYAVEAATDGVAALAAATSASPDVVILDVMLPGIAGTEVCRRLRATGSTVPIIMLSARGQELDKVLGLKLGADDYVTKPFSFAELFARVEAVLRRAERAPAQAPVSTNELRVGDLVLDCDGLTARRGDATLDLSAREFNLLRFLVERRGEVVTRDELLEAVWGFTRIPYTRTVDTHIAKLRKKLGDDSSTSRYIVTVHRVGYKFVG